MKQVRFGSGTAPAVVVGCMRINALSDAEMNHFVHSALDLGANFFDHADVYGGGRCEELFGRVLAADNSLRREDFILQSKCGIRHGKCYDQSKEYIVSSVEGSLKRLGTDYLDVLLLHRPDALVEPEEVAAAFDELYRSGKVRAFGVSNHKPSQIELLKKYVEQPLICDQLQFSIPVSNMIANGMEVNMTSPGSADRDGSVLDYCRLNDVTIQAWSPFQQPDWAGPFIGSDAYPKLNETLTAMGAAYDASETTIAAAWILRHPAGMQIISGSTNEHRLAEVVRACEINLSREDWYRLYLDAGHPLP